MFIDRETGREFYLADTFEKFLDMLYTVCTSQVNILHPLGNAANMNISKEFENRASTGMMN